MPGGSLSTWVTVLWAAATTVFAALLVYSKLIGREEEDQLFLDASESKLEAEKTLIVSRLNRVAPYTRAFGFASLALLLVMFGFWLYDGYVTFKNPAAP
jgi:hypothetical protein